MSQLPNASVIISTYKQPAWLDLVLYSYLLQTEKSFEVLIADDGSGKDTEDVITRYKNHFPFGLKHIWQEDRGFQKTKILNKAITSAISDYLIFTDGDCMARKDFVETHLSLRKKNHALSGGYFKLNQSVSQIIDKSLLEQALCFDKKWLLKKGQHKSFKMHKLSRSPIKARLLDFFTPTKATFDGMNVSCWKDDMLAVNGFDERMQYGGEDREVGERLMNRGIRFKQVRYRAICVHLYHERPYNNMEALEVNQQIRRETKLHKATYTKFGLIKE
jgi:glycosyltransferase involved in cell wall biosynthesis